MKKEDYFDLIIKGFGVYLLVLAIIQIPSVLNGLLLFVSYIALGGGFDFSGDADAMSKIENTIRATTISKSLAGIFTFAIYIIASINFLRSGSWVKKLMGKTKIVEQSPSSDVASAPPDEA